MPPGQSSITWQGPPVSPPGTPNAFPDPVTLSGQIDSATGAISGASLTLPPMVQPPNTGQIPTFAFSEVHPGTATGTFDSTTGAVTLNDSLKLTFTAEPIGITCVSTPIDVALSGTYDSATEDVTLTTTSSFTIPQFPASSGSHTCGAASASLNASPGGVAGAVGNAMTLTLNGQFAPGLPTTTTLAASPESPALAGTAVALTATVTDPSSAGTPAGSVNFFDNGANVGTATLSSGTATLTTARLPGGSNQQLIATYAGDPTYAGSTSSAVSYTVNPVPSVTTAPPSSLTVPTSSAPPTVTALSPTTGPPAGGTKVTITGTGFIGGATVKFGPTKAGDVTVVNSSTITATAPAGTGTLDVTVTTPNGTSSTAGGTASLGGSFPAVPVATDLFSYGTPTVTAVTPNAGNAAKGFAGPWVITGTNFTPAATVQVGTYQVGPLSTYVNSATQITLGLDSLFVAGGGVSTGTWDVTVTTPNGTSPTSANDQLTVGPSAPLVTGVSPTGATAGGTTVTLTGQGFTGATAVDFGKAPATSFTTTSDEKVTAVAPAGTAGTVVDVTVTTPSGTSSSWWADQFAYGAPTVAGVSPDNGPAAGGSAVTVTGTGFVTGSCSSSFSFAPCSGPSGGSTVKFGSKAATGVTVVSPTEITAIAPAGTSTVDVTVTNGAGTSSTTPSDQFTYGPAVTSVTPPSGAVAGGTSVTISGTGLIGATAVNFGTAAATTFSVNDDTSITATVPRGTSGGVDVTVTTPAGTSPTSAADQYFYGAPKVIAVAPNAGPLAGGTTVTVSGTGFTGASAVEFTSTAATSFTVNSSTSITAVAPPRATAGVTYVRVVTSGGTSSLVAASTFTYSSAPSVSSVSPNSPTGSATVVTVTGANFTGASSVSFGSTAATSFTVHSDTSITATAPPGRGTVDVTVASADGTSAIWPGDQFAYSPPTVTSVSPKSGPLAGGTGVVVRGTGFAAGATVNFGATPATSVTVVSPTELTTVSPAEDAGAVDVTVTTLGGTSATSGADQFTYSAAATTPAQFDLTITNPSSGQAWDSMYAKIVLSGTTGQLAKQPISNVTLSYEDASGDWCPLQGTGTTRTFTYSVSGTGSSCGSRPGSMSIDAGGSLVIPMQLSYASGTYLGTQSVTTTLYSGTCSGPTSCAQSGALNGQSVGNASVNLVPVARLDVTMTGGAVASALRQSFSLAIPTMTVTATNQTTGVPVPTGTVSWQIDGSPVDVIPQSGGGAVSSVTLLARGTGGSTGTGSYLYDTTDLSPGIHTLATQYSGDGVYAPASLLQTFTVLPAPQGTLFICDTGSAPFNGYVTVSSDPPSPTLSSASAWLSNIGVSVDYDPVRGASSGSATSATTFALSPDSSVVAVGAPQQSASETDNTLVFSGMATSVPVTGSPGSTVGVSLVGSFSYVAGPGASPFSCTASSGGAPVATIPVAGNVLTVSPSASSAPGAPVTLTDTVHPSPSGGVAPDQSGQVDFYDGSTDLGTVPVDSTGDAGNGTAVLTTNQLALGTHQLTAVWSGSGSVPANTSNEVDSQVGSTATTTLASSANPADAANPVTFTATVNGASGSPQPTGDVSFTEDGNPITSCQDVGLSTATPPVATCEVTLGAGETHSITATYSGDATYTGSTSDPVSQVTLPGTVTSIISTKDPSPPGNVTFWAGVSPASSTGATPTGTVAFTIDGATYKPCSTQPLGPGAGASCTVSFKAGTSHKVSAAYVGGASYSGSKSTTITQTVTGGKASTKPKDTGGSATLASGKALTAGQSIATGSDKLVMQRDGNLVEYQGAKARWASHTAGHPGTGVVMQKDGNLVEYNHGHAIWASNTWGHPGSHLTLQGTDGNVVIYTPANKPIWSTGT